MKKTDSREQIAQNIARDAAVLVANGNATRSQAIGAAAERQKRLLESNNDTTGTQETLAENQPFQPNTTTSKEQIASIASDLADEVRDAVWDFPPSLLPHDDEQ